MNRCRALFHWACGATDNASDYGSEDSRFESWQARTHFCAVQSLDLAFLAVIEQVQQIESVVIERQQREKVYCVQLSVIHARSLTAVTDLKRHGLFCFFMSDIHAALKACNAYVRSLTNRS